MWRPSSSWGSYVSTLTKLSFKASLRLHFDTLFLHRLRKESISLSFRKFEQKHQILRTTWSYVILESYNREKWLKLKPDVYSRKKGTPMEYHYSYVAVKMFSISFLPKNEILHFWSLLKSFDLYRIGEASGLLLKREETNTLLSGRLLSQTNLCSRKIFFFPLRPKMTIKFLIPTSVFPLS